ncbi:MAG: hypothetical protein JF606_27570 [Burkholderiales bacterium]|nr:hypothetical protein [Burkholderiales bacterium]
MQGQGQRGAGDARGDLELEIAAKPHALFRFDAQRRLRCTVRVDLFKFLVGGVIEVPTLGGGASVVFDLARGRVQEIDGKGYPGRDRVCGALMLCRAAGVSAYALRARGAVPAIAGQRP